MGWALHAWSQSTWQNVTFHTPAIGVSHRFKTLLEAIVRSGARARSVAMSSHLTVEEAIDIEVFDASTATSGQLDCFRGPEEMEITVQEFLLASDD